MNRGERERCISKIEELISEFGQLDRSTYLELLEEMSDRADNAIAALSEDEDDSNEDDDV